MLSEKQKQYQREYYRKNKEKIKLRSRLWRKNNPEKVRKTKKEYRKNNKEKVAAQCRSWRKRNTEYYRKWCREYRRRYRLNNLERCKENDRRSYYRNREKKLEKSRARRLEVYDSWVARIKETFGGSACSKCGYDNCFDAIDLHHLDPSKKDISISRLLLLIPTEERVAKLDDIILLCKNCHAEVHRELRQKNRRRVS